MNQEANAQALYFMLFSVGAQDKTRKEQIDEIETFLNDVAKEQRKIGRNQAANEMLNAIERIKS